MKKAPNICVYVLIKNAECIRFYDVKEKELLDFPRIPFEKGNLMPFFLKDRKKFVKLITEILESVSIERKKESFSIDEFYKELIKCKEISEGSNRFYNTNEFVYIKAIKATLKKEFFTVDTSRKIRYKNNWNLDKGAIRLHKDNEWIKSWNEKMNETIELMHKEILAADVFDQN